MSAVTQPWMKFYPQDWRADEKLRLCSLAARGLWIEMLAIMHRSERYGLLLISGRAPTDAQLAVQVGAPPEQVSAMIAELEEADVFSRATGGVIYSRRMTRDQKKAVAARKNGRKGGNPTLGKQKDNSGQDNPKDNHPLKGGDKPQIPEARGQKNSPTPQDENSKGGGKDYAFSGKTIRLLVDDLDRWRKAYHAIPDILGELYALDDWLQKQDEDARKRWFHVVSSSLNKKHQALLKDAVAGGPADLISIVNERERRREAAGK